MTGCVVIAPPPSCASPATCAFPLYESFRSVCARVGTQRRALPHTNPPSFPSGRDVGSYTATPTDVEGVRSCAMAIFSFIFQCRAVNVAHMALSDVTLTSGCVTAKLRPWKGKSYRRPMILLYFDNPAAEAGSGLSALLLRWVDPRPASDGPFNFRAN